ncbi:Glucan endo-1,3-beta-glucosidase 14 [Hibiscus syriacus]|uniref:glucan endo-1,3-beta-D-glucosidase n=1 Tax=Hibiscus syriacus TaxID=106335 RepID=A0A6A2WQZ5_HIBSY|nr:glucan endo-1,3-beta-glucosidase 14-like isoform X1 [Hibiscus syriacus]KAE8656740.1 Glucan endo-1,3-beta-glucosidase 14 [Hibiscus syriacus]
MAACSSLLFPLLLVLLTFSDSSVEVHGLGVGINYGQIANNLPSPTRVSHLLRSLNISRVKLYDADPNVLVAFSNTNVDFIIGLGNEYLQNMTDPIKAQTWVQQRVQPYLTRTRITCITVGNEVFKYNDHQQWSNLLPAMQTVYNTLVNLGLDKQVSVTTAHSLDILSVSFPPSAGAFRQDIGEYLHGILNFHAQVKSPFLINAYPYFAYKDSPNEVPLDYVLFQPNQGTMDPFTNLKYDNMLYAQVDAVYSAIKAIGHTDIEVRVSETGWPSKGDENEVGATPENAGLYNGNLFKRVEQRQGTPAKPNVPIDIYVFALFNENLKTGPASERNYGLFYPDGTLVYNIGVQGYLPELIYSSATKNNGFLVCSLLILAMTYLIFS